MIIRSLFLGLAGLFLASAAQAGGGALSPEPPEEGWPFDGPFGTYDRESMQRGYQVYQEICSACHGLKLLSYRNLGQKGAPFYDPKYPNPNDNPLVKAFAAQNTIIDPNPDEDGDYVERPAIPADRFRSPFANEPLARKANGGALPPDLSVITKARKGGASYVYRLMLGYADEEAFTTREVTPASDGGTPDDPSDDTPAEIQTLIDVSKLHLGGHGDEQGDHERGYLIQTPGQYYNPYMPGDTTANYIGDPRHPPAGGFLAMPPQLQPRVGVFEYMDGTPATAEQMAYDVAQFLAWASDPKQDARKRTGFGVMLFLFLLAGLFWLSYKQLWRDVEH